MYPNIIYSLKIKKLNGIVDFFLQMALTKYTIKNYLDKHVSPGETFYTDWLINSLYPSQTKQYILYILHELEKENYVQTAHKNDIYYENIWWKTEKIAQV